MNFIEYPDQDFLNLRLAGTIASQLADFIRREGRATLCLPGGRSPIGVMEILSGVDLDWEAVQVVLSDERWVDTSSDRSNTKLLQDHFFKGRAAKAQYIPLYDAQFSRPEDAIEHLNQGLLPALPISVALLGMGEDMHTASLFPNAPGIEQALANDAANLMAFHPQSVPEARISVTAPVLRQAFHIHVMITGTNKRVAIEQAVALPPHEAPIRIVLDHADVHWAK